MTIAYVLINSELGQEKEIMEQLGQKDFVESFHEVYGVYDIVSKIEGKTQEEVKAYITNDIRNMEYVRSTLTLLVI